MRQPRFPNIEVTPLQADFIPSLQQPTQQVLWIGCSDSCFQETKILDLLPDEMMVLRNMGNMIIDGDLSCETTVKHAVSDLNVRHIVVCGHYGCGIVKSNSRDGLQGPWSSKLNSLHSMHKHTIDQLPSSEHDHAFVKLNVLDQLRSLRRFPEVARAAKSGNLQLHGIVYDRETGKASRLLEDIEVEE
ncbi:carbonic anhydrase [Penicillium sp. IBT 18751x]|nr:carbonic anhydrase [Penicillium sp. IBT 18751x]